MLNDMNSIDLILHVTTGPLLRTRSSPSPSLTSSIAATGPRTTSPAIDCTPPTSGKMIFIPLKDDIRDHWFLLVMKLSQKNAELWDSQPDTGSGARRVEKARAAMLLLQNIFANEMTKSQDVYYDFPSFPCQFLMETLLMTITTTVASTSRGTCSPIGKNGLKGTTPMNSAVSLHMNLSNTQKINFFIWSETPTVESVVVIEREVPESDR
ncbi:hypothetical protein M0R45_035757 [Rubus argutus]|uniref:Ubiquitin-like protease family profile domain-containing protein n=1 Tax=Rubus argutus TaxID=59490 RepID=A0AAW1VZD3_RUBAR